MQGRKVPIHSGPVRRCGASGRESHHQKPSHVENFQYRMDLFSLQSFQPGERSFETDESAEVPKESPVLRIGGSPIQRNPSGVLSVRRLSAQVELSRSIRVHRGEKPYMCEGCGGTFTAHPSHLQHLKVHSREKPCECNQCGKAFHHSSNLMPHQRIHSREKCKCKECGSAFSRQSHLTQHQRTHSGEKPYDHTACGKAFSA